MLLPERDYRRFRLKKLTDPEFSHLKYLLFWPFFGAAFLFVERFYKVENYYSVHCFLDDYIPFCEFFLIPYLFWFVFLIGIHLYTLLYDVESFKKLMKYIIFTYSFSILVYLVFPTCQELRPAVFERQNLFTEFLKGFYEFDTNTNVCPSIHVIGSLAAAFTAAKTKGLDSPKRKFLFFAVAILICMSTVFLKQHSIIDVLAAFILCFAAYPFFFGKRDRQKSTAQ